MNPMLKALMDSRQTQLCSTKDTAELTQKVQSTLVKLDRACKLMGKNWELPHFGHLRIHDC
jgi:hypothetical protein